MTDIGDVSAEELISTWWRFSEAALAVSWRPADGLDDTESLSLPAFDVLVRLYHAPAQRLPMTRLAAALGLSSGGFAKLADRIELEGLLVVEHNPADPGSVDAELTEHGRRVTAAALSRHVADLRRTLLTPLGTQGLRALASLSEALQPPER